MVIWINGAFGAGKTRVARRILALRPGAILLDPERIGFMLRRLLPMRRIADFQDLPLWRELTVRIVREAAAEAGPVIVPMTLADPARFEEVVGGLRAGGVDLRHFTLMASPETLRRRLRRRLDWPSSRRWALAQAAPAAAALADPAFAEHVDTEGRKVAEIADDILAQAGA
jgi:predicted kinase